MKIINVLSAFGVLALTFVGLAFTHANKNHAGVTTACISGIAPLHSAGITNLSSSHFTTIKAAGTATVYLRTAISNTKLGTLTTCGILSKKIYYH